MNRRQNNEKIFENAKEPHPNKNSRKEFGRIENHMGEKEVKLIRHIYAEDFKRFKYSLNFEDYKKPPLAL
jgi:hypothetical protein